MVSFSPMLAPQARTQPRIGGPSRHCSTLKKMSCANRQKCPASQLPCAPVASRARSEPLTLPAPRAPCSPEAGRSLFRKILFAIGAIHFWIQAPAGLTTNKAQLREERSRRLCCAPKDVGRRSSDRGAVLLTRGELLGN